MKTSVVQKFIQVSIVFFLLPLCSYISVAHSDQKNTQNSTVKTIAENSAEKSTEN